MTIKAWVNPPVSLALSELQIEFGCVPLPPTTTTTQAPQTSTTTSTTSTSTSSTTTLAPSNYNPSITFTGFPATLKSGSQTTYSISSYIKGNNYSYEISGGPPGATFSILVTYSNSTTATITGTLSVSGTYTSPVDSSSLFPLGLLSAVVTFTPLVGQVVTSGNTRTLEVSVIALTTTTTTALPTYNVQFFNASNAVITSANEGDTIRIQMTTTNVANGTSVPYSITGISQADLVGSPSLTGSFIVGGTVSLTVTLSADVTQEGTETLTVTLGTSPIILATAFLVINDTSSTLSGTAYLITNGSIQTLTGTATLPTASVKVMFRLIGGGGSGGGSDDGSQGGSGLGGGVLLGTVTLPATSEPKILKGGVGSGGAIAQSIRSLGGAVDYGVGGIGFSFPSGVGYSSRGGNGSTDGPRGVSGRGGAGGGSTALIVSVGSTTYGVASAGGGAGGGGGSLRVNGGHAVTSTGLPLAYSSLSNLDGQDAAPATDDGGGGGGGGGGAGAAGTAGRDDVRGNIKATGGVSGRPVQNTSQILNSGSWGKFDYYEPLATARDDILRTGTVIHNGWCEFIQIYAVWQSYSNAGSFSVSVPLYLEAGTYAWELSVDNSGSFSIDNVVIGTSNSYSVVSSGTFNVAAGAHLLAMTGNNTGGVGGFALVIRSTATNSAVFTSLDLTQHSYTSVIPSISGNKNYYGCGGFGALSTTVPSTAGTQGAIAVYWTTNLSEAWDATKLPDLPLPTFQLQLPTSDIVDYDIASLILYWNGTTNFPGIPWSTLQYENLSSLFEFKVEQISGTITADNGLTTLGVTYNMNTWYSWSTARSLYSSVLVKATGIGTNVARISIRRKSDQVVQISQNVTFVVNPSNDSSLVSG